MMASETRPFSLTLRNYGFFEPRVVFIAVEENEPLRKLETKVGQVARRELKLLNARYKERAFHPHLTIAFRDLKKSTFYEAKKFYEERECLFEFEVTDLVLFRHQKEEWQMHEMKPFTPSS